MYHTFLSPSEQPPTSLEIKRALLTYERVVIPDPTDRDYFPPQLLIPAFSAGFGIPFPIGINAGPVRPLGKYQNYDAQFDRLMDEVGYAKREGLIDVISSYDQATNQSFTAGAILTGGYPLNTDLLLWAYRNICRDQEALRFAVAGDQGLSSASGEVLEMLAGCSSMADEAINDDAALPVIDGDILREEYREHYSRIARARIAAVMKSIGYCAAKQITPSFRSVNSRNILRHMASRASNIIDTVAEYDPHLTLRSRVLDLAHSEYINEDVLEELSIEDVLRLRTRAWGKQAEARDALLSSAAELAQECRSAADFDLEVKSRIQAYRKNWDDVVSERRRMNFKIKCDLVGGGAKALASGLGGHVAGTLAQLQSGIGAATLLLVGCLVAAEKIKEFGPMRQLIKETEEAFGDHVCFGIHEFYRGF